MMIWQLLQVHHLQDSPLILVGPMWSGLVEWAKHAMMSYSPPLASVDDFAIPKCVADVDQAIEIIRDHHAHWTAANERA